MGRPVILPFLLTLSAILASFWVFQVPFFQEADENAYVDYAFSLYTAGHLFRAETGVPHTDVHPYTRYLEKVAHFREMRYNPAGRASVDYGSAGFYRRVDQGKPPVNAEMFTGVQRPIPYVAAGYSFFFPACEALVLALTSLSVHGSITTMFFAMRFFCLALLLVMLFFSYLTMRELHVKRSWALTLIGALGALPIVSWHGAYVQQDNLTGAAIAVCLYLILKIRRLGLTPMRALPLGLMLGVANTGKPPYAVAIDVAVLLCIFTVTSKSFTDYLKISESAFSALMQRFLGRQYHSGGAPKSTLVYEGQRLNGPDVRKNVVSQEQVIRSEWLWLEHFPFSLFLLIVPSIILVLFSRYFSHSPYTHHMLGFVVSENVLQALHRSWPIAVWTIIGEYARAIWSTFGFGLLSIRFWHGFSMLNYITIGTFGITFVIHAVIVVFTLITLVLMCRRQIVVYRRLGVVVRSRGICRAFSLLGSDPVINAYIVFVVLMISFDALTGGVLSANRYWVAFIVPAFLCGVRYAPSALPRRGRRAFSQVVLALLVTFSLISIPFSRQAVRERFFGPPERTHRETFVRLDEPNGNGMTIATGKIMPVKGVALDGVAGLPARGVIILVDRDHRFTAEYGIPDERTASLLHDDVMKDTGFRALINTSGLRPGRHEAAVFVLSRAGSHLYPTNQRLTFFVP